MALLSFNRRIRRAKKAAPHHAHHVFGGAPVRREARASRRYLRSTKPRYRKSLKAPRARAHRTGHIRTALSKGHIHYARSIGYTGSRKHAQRVAVRTGFKRHRLTPGPFAFKESVAGLKETLRRDKSSPLVKLENKVPAFQTFEVYTGGEGIPRVPRGFGGFEDARGVRAPTPPSAPKVPKAPRAPKAPKAGPSEAAKRVMRETPQRAKTAARRRVRAKVEQVKSTPERVKTAPRRAAQKTKAAPKTVARETKALGTKAGRRRAARISGRKAIRHPVYSAGTGLALAGQTKQGRKNIPGATQAGALTQGTLQALIHHPKETTFTTARALPGAITAPAALGYSAALSAVHGDPRPLEKTAKGQFEGLTQLGGHLLSGDPKTVEKAVQKEGGLALAVPLPALTRTKAYGKARTVVRAAARDTRRGITRKTKGKINLRHAPKGVEQRVFATSERRAQRKHAAATKQHADNPHAIAAARHTKKFVHSVEKAKLHGRGADKVLQVMAEFGIRDKRGVDFVRAHGPGDTHLREALDYLDSHPDKLRNKHVLNAVKEIERSNKGTPYGIANMGHRARVMAQSDALGHTRPEDMVPHAARPLTSADTRKGAWDEVAAADKEAGRLRRTAGERRAQARVLKGTERRRALGEARQLTTQADHIERRNKKLKAALEPYTRPEHNLDTSQRLPYDDRLLKEHVSAVERDAKRAGLALAIWTHHSSMRMHGEGLEPTNFPHAAAGAEHMRGRAEQSLEAQDALNRTTASLVGGTIHMPRIHAAGREFTRDIVRDFTPHGDHYLPFTIDGKRKPLIHSGDEYRHIIDSGQYREKDVARFPYREWNQAIKDPTVSDTHLTAILADAEKGRVKGSEPSILVPREVVKELRAQVNPAHNEASKLISFASRWANRTILGLNPSWAATQVVAEGIPMLMAYPELLNPGKVAAIEHDWMKLREDNPTAAARIEDAAGASPNPLATPLDLQHTYGETPKAVIGKGKRAVSSAAQIKPLGTFDRARQNHYRILMLGAEIDRAHRGLSGRAKRGRIGGSRTDVWTSLAKDKKRLNALSSKVDRIAGNWGTFSRYERDFGPLLMFYPFLRYATMFPYRFAKARPATALATYLLAQNNANQLEKIVGGRPTNPLAYAYPVYQSEKGKAVLPGGSRISPGQSALQTAAASGEAPLSAINPLLASIITAVGGPTSFGTQPSGSHLQAAGNQIISMFAPARLAHLKLGSTSDISKALTRLDPNKTKRSLLDPGLPLSASRLRAQNHILRLMGAISKKPTQGDIIKSLQSENPESVRLFLQAWNEPNPRSRERLIKSRIDLVPKTKKLIGQLNQAHTASDELNKVLGSPSVTQHRALKLSGKLFYAKPKAKPSGRSAPKLKDLSPAQRKRYLASVGGID